MFESLGQMVPEISIQDLNILLLLGLALFGGTVGGRIFQFLKIPQVVGYIIIGIIVGQSGFHIIHQDIITIMQPFNYFALGLIGFMIGGELKKSVFKRYGKQFTAILFSEGMSAFFFVTILIGSLGSLIFGGGLHFWVLGLLLGAISAATAPAATTDVLWEYKTRGPLTTNVLGIVAMDDALSLILFAIASNIAARIMGHDLGGMLKTIIYPIYEVGGAVVVGLVSGLGLSKLIKKYNDRDKMLALSLGTVLFVLGLSLTLKVDMLLASMALGVVVVNYIPKLSEEVFDLISGFAPPIYVLFFVLVGAKLNLYHMTFPMILITLIYLVGRTAGKMMGANLGAKIGKAPRSVSKYLPFCLFSQAGVAIGLSIVAYHTFPGLIGDSIVMIITASTFVVQIIGPPSVKYAITKAGEVGLNITEEDLIKTTKLETVMDKNPPFVYQNMNLSEILNIFVESDNLYYPAVDKDKKLKGIITLESMKQTFMHSDLGNLLLAHDIMEPVRAKVFPNSSLVEAKEIMDRYNLDYLPVVTEDDRIIGFTERRKINKFISTKMIELEHKAYSLAST